MRELAAKVERIMREVPDAAFAAELIIDVVARGLGRLGGRPKVNVTEPVSEVSKPVLTGSEGKKLPPNPPLTQISDLIPDPESDQIQSQSVSLAGNALVGKALPKLKRRLTPARAEPVYDPAFERIWAETGRSGNKFPGFEAWLANGSPPADEVLEGWRHAQRYDRRWKGSDPHIPHLSTWLNALGWRDRPTPNGANALRSASPAEQIQAMQAKEREAREYRRRSDEAADEIAAQVAAALREAEAAVNP